MLIEEEPLELISCLCITRKRIKFLKRVIRCFNDQSFNNKELIIVYESDDLVTEDFLLKIDQQNIIKIKIPFGSVKKTLGELRNIAIQKSNGIYFCQWDDDDYYAPNRLSYQYEEIKKHKKGGHLLHSWIVYDHLTNQSFLSKNTQLGGWEGTLMFNRKLFLEEYSYPHLARGEDTDVIIKMKDNNTLCYSVNPWLYIYNITGENTWPREKFEEGRKTHYKRLNFIKNRKVRKILNH